MNMYLSVGSLLSTLCFLLFTTILLSAAEIREFEQIYNVNNCAELITKGISSSGIYNLNVKVWQGRKTMQVYCDMDTEEGGWTVIQRRTERDGHHRTFYRNDAEYSTGFGDLAKEFWLGNENIHILTAADDLVLRVELEDFEGEKAYAQYEVFFVENDRGGQEYRLFIGNYSGNAGDAMSKNNGMTFAAYDRGYKITCPRNFKSGWWHNLDDCTDANLNGVYSRISDGSQMSIFWFPWKGYNSLKTVELKVRPMKFIPT